MYEKVGYAIGPILSLVLVLLLHVVLSHGALHNNCRYLEYYDYNLQKCRPCSQCPAGQLVQHSCDLYTDTVCGNYIDLDGFRLVVLTESKDSSKHNGSSSASGSGSSVTPHLNLSASVQTDAENWRVLAYGLIGLLSAVSVALAIFILIACLIVRRRRAPINKESDTDEPVMVTLVGDYANPYDATTATTTTMPMTSVITMTNPAMTVGPRTRRWDIVASLIEEVSEEDENEEENDDDEENCDRDCEEAAQ